MSGEDYLEYMRDIARAYKRASHPALVLIHSVEVELLDGDFTIHGFDLDSGKSFKATISFEELQPFMK